LWGFYFMFRSFWKSIIDLNSFVLFRSIFVFAVVCLFFSCSVVLPYGLVVLLFPKYVNWPQLPVLFTAIVQSWLSSARALVAVSHAGLNGFGQLLGIRISSAFFFCSFRDISGKIAS